MKKPDKPVQYRLNPTEDTVVEVLAEQRPVEVPVASLRRDDDDPSELATPEMLQGLRSRTTVATAIVGLGVEELGEGKRQYTITVEDPDGGEPIEHELTAAQIKRGWVDADNITA